jgi:hypothetical protein
MEPPSAPNGGALYLFNSLLDADGLQDGAGGKVPQRPGGHLRQRSQPDTARYWSASARWGLATASASSRSAMVRATFRTR